MQAESDIERKWGAAKNQQKASGPNLRKLEEDDDFHLKTVTQTLADNIRWARNEKHLTQVELAAIVGEKVIMIRNIETPGSILNKALVAKIENRLGYFLRGQKARQPKFQKSNTASASAAKK
ncbi:multiprotein-bridging factor 1 [Cichlidogyrus casuarinus]|uniref:Multiprotein-bridging factor 1 n=1 Tax=Cichlidogyrus casuarinus TaxID=1844966 RepID=A0ABD2QBG5_9PLAT